MHSSPASCDGRAGLHTRRGSLYVSLQWFNGDANRVQAQDAIVHWIAAGIELARATWHAGPFRRDPGKESSTVTVGHSHFPRGTFSGCTPEARVTVEEHALGCCPFFGNAMEVSHPWDFSFVPPLKPGPRKSFAWEYSTRFSLDNRVVRDPRGFPRRRLDPLLRHEAELFT